MNISFPPKITVQSHVLPFFSTSDYCPKSSFVVCQGYERKEYNNIRSQLQSRIDYARFKKDIFKTLWQSIMQITQKMSHNFHI